MVALRTSVFVFILNDVLTNKIVCFKEELIKSNILQSMLFRVFELCLMSLNIGDSRRKKEVDSISEPQLQRGLKQIGKLSLNLLSHR